MKKTAYLLVVAVLICAAPVFAQGPFADVPTDHWAYDAVNQLQKDGIVIGYPDGTYGGKRAMSRYEFAVAIARLMPMLNPNLADYVTNEQLNNILKDYAKKSDLPDLSKYATKADVDALRKLIDEFRDELAALGVDVDALKRDVAALTARVEALEAEIKRVRLTGDVNVFAFASNHRGGEVAAVDRDERIISTGNTFLREIGVVKDFDLNIVGRVSSNTTAKATINYGNYLNYLAWVDDYVDGPRPTSKSSSGIIGTFGESQRILGADSLSDNFFPYYLYIETALGSGNLQVGRFPIQWTPYTLKKIDVDSYTSILKTDDGNYPVDGVKLAWDFGVVDLTLYAAKHDENDYLVNGLTGQPRSGLYNVFGVFHDAGGNAVGGLGSVTEGTEPVTQSAGARALIGTPWKGNLGLTYYRVWDRNAFEAGADYDRAQVFGADFTLPLGKVFNIAASWTQSDTLASDAAAPGTPDVDDDNTAWDARLGASWGKLALAGGYKRIEHNFAAAGAWDKIGRWTNPTDIKGPYFDASYAFSRKLKFVANAEFLSFIDLADADVTKAEAGLKWGLSSANSVDLGYEWIRFDPDDPTLDEGTESYLTVGWAHQFSPNAGMKIGYQFINWDGQNTDLYGANYRGGLGVVQFGVSF